MEQQTDQGPLVITKRQKQLIKRFSIGYLIFALLLTLYLPIDSSFKRHYGYSINEFFTTKAGEAPAVAKPFKNFNEFMSHILGQITNDFYLKATILIGLWVLILLGIVFIKRKNT